MSNFVLLDLSAMKLVQHPLPSGKLGAVCFDSPEAITEYTTLHPGPVKPIRLTIKELKSIPNRIEW